jgi:hypothetical protein
MMQDVGIPQDAGAEVTCHLMHGSIATFIGRVSQAVVTESELSKQRVPVELLSIEVGVYPPVGEELDL